MIAIDIKKENSNEINRLIKNLKSNGYVIDFINRYEFLSHNYKYIFINDNKGVLLSNSDLVKNHKQYFDDEHNVFINNILTVDFYLKNELRNKIIKKQKNV